MISVKEGFADKAATQLGSFPSLFGGQIAQGASLHAPKRRGVLDQSSALVIYYLRKQHGALDP